MLGTADGCKIVKVLTGRSVYTRQPLEPQKECLARKFENIQCGKLRECTYWEIRIF